MLKEPLVTQKQRIAIIGSGISGLVCAHVLGRRHEVTLFEAASYAGGHTNTIDVALDNGNTLAVDTGFIVFNQRTYPNFIALLDQLGIDSQATSMSFSVSDPAQDMEYASHLKGLLARRRNAIDPRFGRMLLDKFRFDRLCKELLANNPAQLEQLSLGEFLDQHRFSPAFARWYIQPMTAAVWSAPLGKILDYPMLSLTTFLSNHGLLGVNDAPTWRVIKGGSRSYVQELLSRFSGQLRLNTPVRGVTRHADKVEIELSDGRESFDQVIFACHSDQALTMLRDPSATETEVLRQIRYQDNQAVLHTDTSLLPKRQAAYAAWNYQIDDQRAEHATLTYNMNALQGLDQPETYCVTLNQTEQIDPSKIIRSIHYAHPVYDQQSVAAQQRWGEISGLEKRSHFAGAYWFYGFHEDGTRSGLRVCNSFGCDLNDAA